MAVASIAGIHRQHSALPSFQFKSGRSFLCILKAGADRCSLLFPACTLRRIPPRYLQKERIYVQRLLLGLGAFTCLDSYTDS